MSRFMVLNSSILQKQEPKGILWAPLQLQTTGAFECVCVLSSMLVLVLANLDKPDRCFLGLQYSSVGQN